MSRVGKKSLTIPDKVDFKIEDDSHNVDPAYTASERHSMNNDSGLAAYWVSGLEEE